MDCGGRVRPQREARYRDPVTERELIDQLCDLRPEWTERRAEIHEGQIYYVDGADLGRELVEAVISGVNEPWVRAGFAVIERALTTGTELTKNLVVVGLFEAMQGPAYHHAEPPDLVDGWLGPLSLAAWADLIEGWTGEGIRSVAAWKNVIINGPRHLVVLRAPELELDAQLAAGRYPPRPPSEPLDPAWPNQVRWRCGDRSGEWIPTVADTERIVCAVQPLAGRLRLGPGHIDAGEVHATLAVDGAQGPATIAIGAVLDDNEPAVRVAGLAGQLYAIDFAALIARWMWITER